MIVPVWCRRFVSTFLSVLDGSLVGFPLGSTPPNTKWECVSIVSVGAMVVTPEMFPQDIPTKSGMENRSSELTKIVPSDDFGLGGWESVWGYEGCCTRSSVFQQTKFSKKKKNPSILWGHTRSLKPFSWRGRMLFCATN